MVLDTCPISVKGTTMSLQQILSTLNQCWSGYVRCAAPLFFRSRLFSKLEALLISKGKESDTFSSVNTALRRSICKIKNSKEQLISFVNLQDFNNILMISRNLNIIKALVVNKNNKKKNLMENIIELVCSRWSRTETFLSQC